VVHGRLVRPPSAPPSPFLCAPVHSQVRPVASRGVAPRPLLDESPSGARVTDAPEGGGSHTRRPRGTACMAQPCHTAPLHTGRGAPSPPAASLRAPPPLDNPSSGARVIAAPEGDRGAPTLAFPLLARPVWPTSATQAPVSPAPRRRVPFWHRRAPPTIRGGHRRRRPGQHPGPTLGGCRLAVLARPKPSGRPAPWPWAAGTATPSEGGTATAGHLGPTLGEPVPSQSRGDTWIRVRGDRIQSVRNGHWLSRGKYVLLTHISNHSGGDPLMITP